MSGCVAPCASPSALECVKVQVDRPPKGMKKVGDASILYLPDFIPHFVRVVAEAKCRDMSDGYYGHYDNRVGCDYVKHSDSRPVPTRSSLGSLPKVVIQIGWHLDQPHLAGVRHTVPLRCISHPH